MGPIVKMFEFSFPTRERRDVFANIVQENGYEVANLNTEIRTYWAGGGGWSSFFDKHRVKINKVSISSSSTYTASVKKAVTSEEEESLRALAYYLVFDFYKFKKMDPVVPFLRAFLGPFAILAGITFIIEMVWPSYLKPVPYMMMPILAIWCFIPVRSSLLKKEQAEKQELYDRIVSLSKRNFKYDYRLPGFPSV